MKTALKFYFFLFTFFSVAIVSAQAPVQTVPVKELLQPYVERGELPGVVTVIATKDKILQINALGLADVETQRPMRENTVFWMASQTKPVTAVAVMMLVDEGKLSLDEPITKYLPEMGALQVLKEKNENQTVLVPPDKPITLRQLLSHTSGTVFLSPIQMRFGIDSMPSDKALLSYAMTPLAHQPGTKYLYSNIGINIAAGAVERVSGMPLEKFLKKRLFEPLGMDETSFWPTEDQMKRLAKAYRWDKEKNALAEVNIGLLTYPFNDRIHRFSEGGGGLFSTATDWVRFYQMLANEGTFEGKRILSAGSVREIRTKQTGDLPDSYGLGVGIGGTASAPVYGHGGSHGTDSKLDTKTGRIAMYLIQQEGLPKAGEAINAFFKAAMQ